MDEMSKAEQFNLVEGRHTTNKGEKDHIGTDLVVTDDGGEILGRDDDDLVSSASGTLEAVDGRLGSDSDLGWSLNFRCDPRVDEENLDWSSGEELCRESLCEISRVLEMQFDKLMS